MSSSVVVYDFMGSTASPVDFAPIEHKSGTPVTFCVFQNKMEILTNEKNKEYGAQLLLSKTDFERIQTYVMSIVENAKEQLTGGAALTAETMHPIFKAGRYNTIRVKVPNVKTMKFSDSGSPRDNLFEAEEVDVDADHIWPNQMACVVVVQLTGIWRKNVKLDEGKKDNEKMWGISFRATRVLFGENQWYDAPSFRARVLDGAISTRRDPEGKEIAVLKLSTYDKGKRKASATELSEEEKAKREQRKLQKAERKKTAKEIEAPKL